MKNKQKKLTLIDKIKEDSERELNKAINIIKPEIDRAVGIFKAMQATKESLLKSSFNKPMAFLNRSNFNSVPKKPTSSINTIFLNEDGDLYKKPKEKYCYKMASDSKRLEIIKYLMKNDDYNKTNEIKEYVNSASDKAVAESIRAINRNILNRLNINENFIESRQGSGYRINQKFEIIFE